MLRNKLPTCSHVPESLQAVLQSTESLQQRLAELEQPLMRWSLLPTATAPQNCLNVCLRALATTRHSCITISSL